MKTLKKITAIILCFTFMLISPISALALEKGTWNITGAPNATPSPKTIVLDHCSEGYKIRVSVLEGTSPNLTIVTTSTCYTKTKIPTITKVTTEPFGKPDVATATVPFVVKLIYDAGKTGHSEGYIARNP